MADPPRVMLPRVPGHRALALSPWRASGTTRSGGPGNPWQGGGGSQPGWLATDDNAARGRPGAASPAVLLPGALNRAVGFKRPPDVVTLVTMYDFDVLVIGSGPSGQKAAIATAKLGRQVAIVERKDMIGGVCLNTGTIPSKTLREAVLYLTGLDQREMYGQSYRV